MACATKSTLLATGLLAAATFGLTNPAAAKCPKHLLNCDLQAIKEQLQVMPDWRKRKPGKVPPPRSVFELSERAPVVTQPITTAGPGPMVIPERRVQLRP